MTFKEKRKLLGLTQAEVARVAGIYKENYNRFENGKSKMITKRKELVLEFFKEYESMVEEKENLIKKYEKKASILLTL